MEENQTTKAPLFLRRNFQFTLIAIATLHFLIVKVTVYDNSLISFDTIFVLFVIFGIMVPVAFILTPVFKLFNRQTENHSPVWMIYRYCCILGIIGMCFSSTTYRIESSYSCSCDDEASQFKRVTYNELVAKWGTPESQNIKDNGHYSVVWNVPGLWTNSDKILMEFPSTNLMINTESHPIDVRCESDPYVSAGGQTVRAWNAPH